MGLAGQSRQLVVDIGVTSYFPAARFAPVACYLCLAFASSSIRYACSLATGVLMSMFMPIRAQMSRKCGHSISNLNETLPSCFYPFVPSVSDLGHEHRSSGRFQIAGREVAVQIRNDQAPDRTCLGLGCWNRDEGTGVLTCVVS